MVGCWGVLCPVMLVGNMNNRLPLVPLSLLDGVGPCAKDSSTSPKIDTMLEGAVCVRICHAKRPASFGSQHPLQRPDHERLDQRKRPTQPRCIRGCSRARGSLCSPIPLSMYRVPLARLSSASLLKIGEFVIYSSKSERLNYTRSSAGLCLCGTAISAQAIPAFSDGNRRSRFHDFLIRGK